MLARCLTLPTPEMDRATDRALVYLAQHADCGITYSPDAERTDLDAYVDSDWAVGHSTSGWAVFFGGAVIGYGSKRQHSVALSSTEAEIMAASHAASELIYFRSLLRELGDEVSEPTELYVDNVGEIELSKDMKSCQRSRHIERRYLYVRELVAQGEIIVKYVRTETNHADVLTKSLDVDTHNRHIYMLMGKRSAPRKKHGRTTAARKY